MGLEKVEGRVHSVVKDSTGRCYVTEVVPVGSFKVQEGYFRRGDSAILGDTLSDGSCGIQMISFLNPGVFAEGEVFDFAFSEGRFYSKKLRTYSSFGSDGRAVSSCSFL